MEAVKREIDGLGRVVIPAEMREALGIESKDEITIQLKDGGILLSKENKEK